MDEAVIAQFWDAHPCGEQFVEAPSGDFERFFDDFDRFRYAESPFILTRLDALDLSGKRVLEVGLGLGADSEQLIRRGADWSGLDLTAASVERVQQRLAVTGCPARCARGPCSTSRGPTRRSTSCSATACSITSLT